MEETGVGDGANQALEDCPLARGVGADGARSESSTP